MLILPSLCNAEHPEHDMPLGQPSPSALAHSARRTYSKIHAIAFHWQNEYLDLRSYGPEQEAKRLVKAFLKWGWQAQQHRIPVIDSVKDTKSFLSNLTQNIKSDELLLCYYVGHGEKSSTSPERPFHIAQMSSSSSVNATIDWPVIRTTLEAATCDVAMILNCCHGADAWVSRNLELDGFKCPPGKMMCILAATRKDELAFMNKTQSFGTLLKAVLSELRVDAGPSKLFAMSELLDELKSVIGRSGLYTVVDNVQGGVEKPMEPSLQYMPEDMGGNQIWLHRTLAVRAVVSMLVRDWHLRSKYKPLQGPAGEYWTRAL